MIGRCLLNLIDRLIGDCLDNLEDFIKEVASHE